MNEISTILNSWSNHTDMYANLGVISSRDLFLNITEDMYNNRIYNGAEPKCGVTVNGTPYLLKRQNKNWRNVISEYVASNIIRELGGLVHETELAVENNNLVVLCKDFTDEYDCVKAISALSESSIDTDMSRHEYYFEDIVYELGKIVDCDVDKTQKQFLQMYTFDTILGNPDRHIGNWALAKKDSKYMLAPIFDNGASLFPRADFSSLNMDWLKERIYVFPNSKIMFKGKRERSSYNEVWSSEVLPEQLRNWARELPIKKGLDWILHNKYLTDSAKSFYTKVIEMRFRVLICREDFIWR